MTDVPNREDIQEILDQHDEILDRAEDYTRDLDEPTQADTYMFEEGEMKKTIKYLRVERITYKFDMCDIRTALLKWQEIEQHKPGRKLEFEIYEDEDDKTVAAITLIFEEPEEEKQNA